MQTFKLQAEPRTDLGKKAAKNLRAAGMIPAVLNSNEVVELPFKGELKAGEKLVEIGDGKGIISTDLIVSVDNVRKLVYSPDIYAVEIEVNGAKKMAILEGHAEGVKAGGKLQLTMKKLKVRAIYSNVPERLVINVDSLGLGKTMQVGELSFEGLELVNAKNAVVCAVQLTRAARGAQAAAAAGK